MIIQANGCKLTNDKMGGKVSYIQPIRPNRAKKAMLIFPFRGNRRREMKATISVP